MGFSIAIESRYSYSAPINMQQRLIETNMIILHNKSLLSTISRWRCIMLIEEQ